MIIIFKDKIHPGLLIKKELQRRKITQRSFAKSINIPFQNLNIFLLGRQNFNLVILFNIEQKLLLPEGSLLVAMTKYIIYSKPKEMQNINYEKIFDLKTKKYINKKGIK